MMLPLLLLSLWAEYCFALADQLRVSYTPLTNIVNGGQSSGGFSPQFGKNLSIVARDFLGRFDLFERQLECPSGTYECSDGECCYIGQNCVPNGCCNGEDEACGADGCYDPSTEVCCSDTGKSCQKGYECQPGGLCCPAGSVPCGSDSCYDPDTEVCCEDTGEHCQKGYSCVPGGCCPTGQEPCGSSHCYDPTSQICCNSGGEVWACASTETCCGEGQACYDKDTEICCTGGACPESDTCCEEECCRSAATCGTDGFCTLTASPSPSPSPSPTKTTTPKSTTALSTPKTPSISTSSTTTGCSTPTLSTSQTQTETISFVYDPSRSWVAKSGPNAGQTISGSNEAIIINMCDGIKKFNGGAGGNTATLTHGGSCFTKRNRRSMCRQNGISVCGAALQSYISSFYPSGIPSWASAAITAAGDMTCDEFPFASSVEGGDPSTGVAICVPSEDNGWQGRTMAPFFNRFNPLITPGEKYVVQIVGWDCNSQSPTKKRRALGLVARDAFSGGGVNITAPEMYHGFDTTNPGLMLMSMPLGDLTAGSYTVRLNVAGGALNLSLVDYNGEYFNASISESTVNFTLDDDADQVCLAGTTVDKDISVVYSASSMPNSAATTTAAGPTTTKSASSRMEPMYSGIRLLVLSAIVAFLTY